MSFTSPGPGQVRSIKLAVALALGAGALTNAARAKDIEPAEPPSVVLNEILFDPVGRAGNEGSWQWVELAAPLGHSLGSEWTLHDARGGWLATLPDVELSPFDYLVVLFGPEDADLDNLDPEVGTLIFTAGLAWADHLGVEYGGVQLRHQGTVVDELYWGGYPDTPHFSLDFASGHLVEEGESIGRDEASTFTGSESDWAVAGGPNSNGTTIGLPNRVEALSGQDLIYYQDETLNEILIGMSASFEQPGWLRVTGTRPRLLSIETDFDGLGSVRSRGLHVLDIEIDGQPLVLRGEIETVLERECAALATSEKLTCSGELATTDGAYALEFQTVNEYTGAHTLQPTRSYSTDSTWTENGVPYSTHVEGQVVRTWVSRDVQLSVDSRTGHDHGGLGPKAGTSTAIRTRLGDGHYRVESTVERTWPSLPPRPGGDQSHRSVGLEVIEETYTVNDSPLGGDDPVAVTTSYRQTLDGFVWAELEEGAVGELRLQQESFSPGATEYSWVSSFPLRRGDDGVLFDHIVRIDGVWIENEEKTYFEHDITTTSADRELFRLSCAVDPPRAQQVPPGPAPSRRAAARARARTARPKPKPKRTGWQRVKDFGATTVTCVAGGVAAQKKVLETGGKKAVIKMIGKAAAKKVIPIVGWFCTGLCCGKAIGDQIFGP